MVFFRVLPKICLSLIPTERGRFSRCFPKYSQFLYISPARGPSLSGFQISPQRVASEKVRNVRVPRNYFSLHLFPVGEAILGGVLKKVLFPQRVDSEKPVFYLCFEYFFTCSHLERSKVVPASKFSSSRGRSREKSKIKPFEKIFFFPQ